MYILIGRINIIRDCKYQLQFNFTNPLFVWNSISDHPFSKNRKLIIANVKSNYSLKRASVSLHTYMWFAFDIGIASVVFPFFLEAAYTLWEVFSFSTDYSIWETRRKVCGRTDTNGTAPTAGEFYRNIWDHLKYFQRVGLCPADEKERERERERKRGREKRVQTSRPDLHSEGRPSCAIDPRALSPLCRHIYLSSTYSIFTNL